MYSFFERSPETTRMLILTGLILAMGTQSKAQIAVTTEPESYEMGVGPVDVMVMNILGANSRDLITADLDDGTLSVRLNDGFGAFGAVHTVDPGLAINTDVPSRMAAGDVDGDRDLLERAGNDPRARRIL